MARSKNEHACPGIFYQDTEGIRAGSGPGDLETMDLDGLGVKLQPFLLVNQEFLNIFPLIALQLDHLAHFSVVDNGAIASELLLDDFENLLLVEFLRKTLYGSQGLTTIAL